MRFGAAVFQNTRFDKNFPGLTCGRKVKCVVRVLSKWHR
jgi:hypothetical protein